jgi:2,4-dienoyl-CoA reductase-like NADH-dependent reductase (Old Yellow Enzyme family)
MGNTLLFARPRPLGEAEILGLVQAYARTAALAVRAGFGGVQLHAAHGYLASQFLSPRTNLRHDGWGGDATRRRRFLLELIDAVRAAIGVQAVLSVKLNASDFQRGGITPEESLGTIAALSRSSIDVLEISGGSFEAAAMLGVPGRDAGGGVTPPEAYFLDFARSARACFDKPLMVTGGFRSRDAIDAALRSGAVDLVGLARPIALDAQLPRRLLNGSAFDFAHELRRPRWLRRGLGGGLAEVAWHTVQLWRGARGEAPDMGMGAATALVRYLARQTAQMRARARFVAKVVGQRAGGGS